MVNTHNLHTLDGGRGYRGNECTFSEVIFLDDGNKFAANANFQYSNNCLIMKQLRTLTLRN